MQYFSINIMYRIFPSSHRHIITTSQAFPPNSLPPGIEFSLLLGTVATGKKVGLQQEGVIRRHQQDWNIQNRGIQQRVSQVQGRGGGEVESKRVSLSPATRRMPIICCARCRLQA